MKLALALLSVDEDVGDNPAAVPAAAAAVAAAAVAPAVDENPD